MRTLVVTLLAACSLTASRQLFSQARAQEIAAAFSKHKSVFTMPGSKGPC